MKLFIAIIVGYLLLSIGLIFGGRSGQHEIQVEAVKHHSAHWEPTVNGGTVFVWDNKEF